jgi:DNA-binding protein HU-beta
MNKGDLIKALAEELAEPRARAARIFDAVFGENGVILGNLIDPGDKVRVSGFGVFEVKQRNARKARNPVTNEAIDVPAKVVRKFRFLKAKQVD